MAQATIVQGKLKLLGKRAYGHIPHLPGSRTGPADRHIHIGQARIATEKARDYRDTVIVTEKLDGSCVAVWKNNTPGPFFGELHPLAKSGYRCADSPHDNHIVFAQWVREQQAVFNRFNDMLLPGERAVGEWLHQVHGTRYLLPHEPFVLFDIIRMDGSQVLYTELLKRAYRFGFVTPRLISYGQPISIKQVLKRIQVSGHGAVDPVEGAVWRVERDGMCDFMCKYVRHDKVDGKYLDDNLVNFQFQKKLDKYW